MKSNENASNGATSILATAVKCKLSQAKPNKLNPNKSWSKVPKLPLDVEHSEFVISSSRAHNLQQLSALRRTSNQVQ